MTDHLEIKCGRCGQHLTHVCDMKVSEALKRLREYTPEIPTKLVLAAFKGATDNYYYTKGDEDAPFFSEAFLYNLIGKEDARTVLALINNLMRATGVDPSGRRE